MRGPRVRHASPGAGDQDREPAGAVGHRRDGRQQLQERHGSRDQGDQRRRRHPRQEDRGHACRHAEQPRRGQGPGAKGGRRRRVRGVRPGVLGLDPGEHGRDQARADPELHRRRGRVGHAAGQPVHLPHQLRPADLDAEGRALHGAEPQGQDGRGDLRQQRLRQGRARLGDQGARYLGRQGRRRHLDRCRPGRLLVAGAQGQAEQRRRDLRLHQRGRSGARAAGASQAGRHQADRRRDRADEPEGDRARRRRGERRGRARRPDDRRADPQHARVPHQVREGIQVHPGPQRHQGLHQCLPDEGRDREGRQGRPCRVHEGDARAASQRRQGAGRDPRRQRRRQGRPRSRELPGRGQGRQAGRQGDPAGARQEIGRRRRTPVSALHRPSRRLRGRALDSARQR